MTYANLLFAAVILPLSVLISMFDRSSEYKNLILCVTSLVFVIWGRAFAAALLFFSVFADYFLAIAAEGSLKRSKQSAAVFVAVDFIFNASIFILLAHNSLFSSGSPLHLRNALIPVGAGFYTLKAFSYVYDVYSGRIKAERNIFCLLTYTMSYPFLLAGPVVRYGDIEPQIRNRTMDADGLSKGLTAFAIGLAKTVLVVPVLTKLYQAGLTAAEPTLAGAWIGMIAFFGASYFTFMGLSDMGSGIAAMYGFKVDKNYSAVTSKRMLGGLVKSYNTSMVRLFEDIRGSSVIMTLLLAMVGAAFYARSRYIFVFALLIGILLAVEQTIGYERIEKLPSVLKLAVVFALSMLLFSGFAFENANEWRSWFTHLLGKGNLYTLSKSVKYIIINNCWLLAAALISVTPAKRAICAALEKTAEKSPKAYGGVRILKTLCTAGLLLSSLILLAANTAL